MALLFFGARDGEGGGGGMKEKEGEKEGGVGGLREKDGIAKEEEEE